MMNLNYKWRGLSFMKDKSFHLQFNNGLSIEQNVCKFATFFPSQVKISRNRDRCVLLCVGLGSQPARLAS